MHSAARAVPASVGERRFRIAVRNCRRCGSEWPAHLQSCRGCAAVLGEVRLIDCVRVMPPYVSRPVAPALVVVMAIELSRRHPSGDGEWAARVWAALAPRLTSAARVRPGPAGSIVAAWQLERPESVVQAGELALELGEDALSEPSDGAEVRGAIALGVIDGEAGSDAVERCAERLALAAAPGQWLVSQELARRLQHRFVLLGVGIVPRWSMPLPEGQRALVARLAPAALPSAVNGEAPALVLGRGRERRRLLAELAAAGAGRRRVVLVSAPAGGGKSYLLRRLLADAEIKLAAGVAFPPLGSGRLDALRALLVALGEASDGDGGERLGAALAEAATRRARTGPSAVVIDDVHWASQEAVTALHSAIVGSKADVPLAWVLSARTAALPALEELVELADARVELPPLEPADRPKLLSQRLGAVSHAVRAHVSGKRERGNPLYLEHLAEAIAEGCAEDALPGTLHEAVLGRLDRLVERTRMLTHWSHQSFEAGRELEELERELGDWLDRLETSDVADLATIGRYLARLRAVDAELVIARSILRMPVAANRRLAWAVERLAAASTDALLDYLETAASEGSETQAAYGATTAAGRAEQALRLADAERLLAFASRHDPRPELARKRGDLALALGRPQDALSAYQTAARDGDRSEELERRVARAEALLGQAERAIWRLGALIERRGVESHVAYAAALDLARLRGLPPPAATGPCRGIVRRIAKAMAWARVGEPGATRDAIGQLVLDGEPSECAAELIEAAALSRFAGLHVGGLDGAGTQALQALENPHASVLFDALEVDQARRTFLHWDV